MKFHILSSLGLLAASTSAFAPTLGVSHRASTTRLDSSTNDDEWTGDVVSNFGGSIRGCSIQPVGDSVTDWIMTIDGLDADLGRFSEAIYKKIIGDAKQQRFQGFRPGTIPPHLEPTYRAFTMDECARETVLEAMEQNQLRPFTDARNDILIEQVSIPPPIKSKKGGKKKKKKSRKQLAREAEMAAAAGVTEEPQTEQPAQEEPQWQTYDSMKEAIDAGWKPGQSFSFVAKNVKGQKILSVQDTKGARPLGLNY